MNSIESTSLKFILQKYKTKLTNTGYFSKKFLNLGKSLPYNYSNKLVNIVMKKGLKSRYRKIIVKTLFTFYSFFSKNYLNKFDNSKFNIKNIKTIFLKNNILFKPTHLLSFISKSLEPIFSIQTIRRVFKKKKKKKKLSKYKSKIIYLTKIKRKSTFLKWLYLDSFYINDNKLSNRLLYSFFENFFFLKKSNLYLRKIKIYKKALI